MVTMSITATVATQVPPLLDPEAPSKALLKDPLGVQLLPKECMMAFREHNLFVQFCNKVKNTRLIKRKKALENRVPQASHSGLKQSGKSGQNRALSLLPFSEQEGS